MAWRYAFLVPAAATSSSPSSSSPSPRHARVGFRVERLGYGMALRVHGASRCHIIIAILILTLAQARMRGSSFLQRRVLS